LSPAAVCSVRTGVCGAAPCTPRRPQLLRLAMSETRDPDGSSDKKKETESKTDDDEFSGLDAV
jgi:hypothetical protein